jgi:hypothetical protein
MYRTFTFSNSGPQLTVTLSYYTGPVVSSAWYTRTLFYDMTDTTNTEDRILGDMATQDRKVSDAYNLIGILTTLLGDRLGVREHLS